MLGFRKRNTRQLEALLVGLDYPDTSLHYAQHVEIDNRWPNFGVSPAKPATVWHVPSARVVAVCPSHRVAWVIVKAVSGIDETQAGQEYPSRHWLLKCAEYVSHILSQHRGK